MEEITRDDLRIFLMLSLHLTTADGDFSLSEKRLLGRFSRKLGLFKKEKREITCKKFSLASNLRRLSSDGARESLVAFLCAVSHVDGKMDEFELAFIEKVSSRLGNKALLLPVEEWDQYEDRVIALIDGIAFPPKLVVAEDDESIGRMAHYKIQGSGFQILWRTDRENALKLIEELPDLVALDIDMPGTPGFEMLEAMNARPASSSTPATMLTAQGTKVDVNQALNLGAAGYFVNPFRPAAIPARTTAHSPKN